MLARPRTSGATALAASALAESLPLASSSRVALRGPPRCAALATSRRSSATRPTTTTAAAAAAGTGQRRPTSTSTSTSTPTSSSSSCSSSLPQPRPPPPLPSPPRCYRYHVDVHGRVFVHDALPKNLASCLKSVPALDLLVTRIRPNPQQRRPVDGADPEGAVQDAEGEGKEEGEEAQAARAGSREEQQARIDREDEAWHRHLDAAPTSATTDPSLTPAARRHVERVAASMGYRWMSPCQGELNFFRCAPHATPVVFHELLVDVDVGVGAPGSDQGSGTGGRRRADVLRWAGSKTCELDVGRLKVCRETGYLYHPSPTPPLRRYQPARRRRAATSDAGVADGARLPPNPYGEYSLLASSVLLTHFAAGLELYDDDGTTRAAAGSVEWKGTRYDVAWLERGDVGATPRLLESLGAE